MTRALVDANILVYASNADEKEKHRLAKRFMQEVNNNPKEFVLSQQSLREFSYVSIIKSKLSPSTVSEYIYGFQHAFGELLIDLPIDISSAIRLYENHRIPFWDALLASTAIRHEITTIYTENVKDFKRIPGIKAVNPLV